jgi:ketosteroid isomerase-like protein
MVAPHRLTTPVLGLLSGAILLAGAAPPALASRADLDSLVASERAFAALSVEKGMRDAFLTYLADNGVLLRFPPANGKALWSSRSAVPATLLWEPSFAEVSTAGDLGYTTGPSEFRPYDDKEPVEYGHFVSMWRRQPDGTWRVALDVGISHDKPAHGVGSHDFLPGPEHRRFSGAVDPSGADRAWSEDARAIGESAAFLRWTTADVRSYRDGHEPWRGQRAAREALPDSGGVPAFLPDTAIVARSGDLGYSYGILERRAHADSVPDSSVYLHVWRRVGPAHWKAALVLEKPLPKRAQ